LPDFQCADDSSVGRMVSGISAASGRVCGPAARSAQHSRPRIDPKKTRALRNPERRAGRADQEADNPRRVRQSVRRAEMRPATRTCCTRREWSRALRRLADRTAVGQRDREIASSACASEDQRARAHQSSVVGSCGCEQERRPTASRACTIAAIKPPTSGGRVSSRIKFGPLTAHPVGHAAIFGYHRAA
jgi:hypothetical protein